LLTVEDEPVRQYVPYENIFGWMAVGQLNTEGMGALWQKTSVT